MSIYSKTEQGWLPVVGGWSQQTPPAPVIVNKAGGAVVQFTSGGSGSAGPTLVYGATISPSDNGETVVVDQVNLDVSVQGATLFTDYVVSVYGVNIAGNGEAAYTDPFQLSYNSATGGTETVVNDYNGTGEQWMVHAFTSNGTLDIAESPQNFSTLIVAGGNGANYVVGVNAAGGEVIENVGMLSNSQVSVVVGSGGAGGQGGNAQPGGVSQFGSDTAIAGLSGVQVNSTITGTSTPYGGTGSYPVAKGRGGMGAAGTGEYGQSGIVVVAYQIGVSNTAQIRLAQEQRSALADGREAGYGEGFADGSEAANDTLEAIRLMEGT